MAAQLNLASDLLEQARIAVCAGFGNFTEVPMAVRAVLIADGAASQPVGGWDESETSRVAKPFSTGDPSKIVVGTDSTCITIMETSDGAVHAARACAVYAANGFASRCLRLGPLALFSPSSCFIWVAENLASRRELLERLVRIRMERFLQLMLARQLRDSLILIDGPLIQSPLEDSHCNLDHVIEAAHASGCDVLGWSKTRSLQEFRPVADSLRSQAGSCYSLVENHMRCSEGTRSVAVKMRRYGMPYYVELAGARRDDPAAVLGDLSNCDSFYRGYPQTLRLAHHLSLLRQFDLVLLRQWLISKYRLKTIHGEEPRRAALGWLGIEHAGRWYRS